MDLSIDQFVDIIRTSRALSQEQKELFLEDPNVLPAEYRVAIAQILFDFQERSFARERYLSDRLDELLESFEENLRNEGVDEEVRNTLTQKAKKQNEAFRLTQRVNSSTL